MSDIIQVFCFHRVSDEYSPAYPPIPVKVFEKICKYISKNYCIIPIQELNNSKNTGKKKAVITFDDAYYDFYKYALPILVKYNIPAVQHVITNCADTGESFWTQKLNKILENYLFNKTDFSIPELDFSFSNINKSNIENLALNLYLKLLHSNKRNEILNNLELNIGSEIEYTRMMTWDDLNDASKNNITIGSHTCNHANLVNLNKEELNFELLNSKKVIEKNIINANCNTIAFPNGQFNSDVVNECFNVGYEILFSTEVNTININNIPNVLPRYSLYSNTWLKNYIKLSKLRFTT